eukprot:TRINITY_DN67115_c8_g1_i1.p1 TRINITY_DN67115_c8_g1~~TRINITY_DN67115_c8_g1_i1.p1  ORF type:complete len:327 (-),score=-3.28 TRINITY_DN67115_c8_g1_i1:65-1045(-)
MGFVLGVNSTVLLVGLLLLLVLAECRLSQCGKSCKTDLDCPRHCFNCGNGFCRPSCGKPCTTDEDCSVFPANCAFCASNKKCGGYGNFTRGGAYRHPPPKIKQKRAPILPSAWNATVRYVNYTTGEVSHGALWYDMRFYGGRFDFPICPVNGIVEPGYEYVNYQPCSIIFYQGDMAYVYPKAKKCCVHPFNVWTPDVYHKNDAYFFGELDFGGIPSDVFDFTYHLNWRKVPPRQTDKIPLPTYTVQRRVFLKKGTNIPTGMNETLTSSVNYFSNVQLGPQDEDVFRKPFLENNCRHRNRTDPHNPRYWYYCSYYGGVGRLGPYGYG